METSPRSFLPWHLSSRTALTIYTLGAQTTTTKRADTGRQKELDRAKRYIDGQRLRKLSKKTPPAEDWALHSNQNQPYWLFYWLLTKSRWRTSPYCSTSSIN